MFFHGMSWNMSPVAARRFFVGRILGLFCLLALGCVFSASAQNSVDITVKERAGVARQNEAVQFGVPIPRSWNVTNVASFRLRDGAGTPIAAQFEALARWGAAPGDAGAPVKWVLITYFESLAANTSKTITLDASGPGPAPATTLQIDTATPGKMTVDTGAAQFEINTDGAFNLLNQVTVGGQALLQPLPAADAIDYSPAGALALVAGGSPDLTARTTSVTLERAGDLRAIVRIMGSILDDSSQAILDFTARFYFSAGRADIRLDFTVENNHPIIEDDQGQPSNGRNQGTPNSVYIGDLDLNFRLAATASALRVLTEAGVDVSSPASAVRLYQDSSGTDFWDDYVGLVGWTPASAAPRLQSYCTFQGYQVTGGASPASGLQALGWMTAFRDGASEPRLTVAVRDFWQNFPNAIETATDGTVRVNLFPNGSQFRHNFRVGEEKTHTILLHFGTGPATASDSENLAKAFNMPLFGVAPAAWYTGSGVLGEVPAKNAAQWPLYERYVRVAFAPNPEYTDPNLGNTTLREIIERYNFYGWQDYGDVPLDYEGFGDNQAGQMNLKYWYLYGMFLQFCRSGDMNWFDLARPAAWHMADIDYLHIPDEGAQHWAHGAYFGHSEHDEPGNDNPNRNLNSPSVDLAYGVPGLILGYYLTGETRFIDTAREGLISMKNMSQFSDFTNPEFQRERPNLIFGYVEGYRLTGDPQWLTELRTIVGHTADLSNKGWTTNPTAYGASHPHVPDESGYLRMFQFNQTVWALGRYLDFANEYGLNDDLKVATALEAFGDFVINFVMVEYPAGTGRAIHWYDYVFSNPNVENGGLNWMDVNNWALVMADALAYAHKYSGEQRFLDAAAKFYATGTVDPSWEDDPPVYFQSKDLVNSLNWGLVYMNQSASPSTPSAAAAGTWLLY